MVNAWPSVKTKQNKEFIAPTSLTQMLQVKNESQHSLASHSSFIFSGSLAWVKTPVQGPWLICTGKKYLLCCNSFHIQPSKELDLQKVDQSSIKMTMLILEDESVNYRKCIKGHTLMKKKKELVLREQKAGGLFWQLDNITFERGIVPLFLTDNPM
ncbi:hypothetical protein KIL84_018592 [Mauremys mutica]|uniref:Uncharacterized protein n=1 Tax=Mauremys mutica TaxID=74926 RepID=A0A9D3XUZ2_9SAUR|nr:hypothetical protein KIL84_018592 [Mauremys mutica]